MTRSTVKYLAALTLATILFYWKTLLTSQFTMILGSEGVNQTYGWLHFWVRSIWRGHIPLWDPYAFAGHPFAGEMLPSAYYPLQLLFALVPLNGNGMIAPRLYHVVLALTHLLCAAFMFALLRELSRSRFSSFVGACAFSLGGLMVRLMWPPYVEGCIWLPAIFLFLLRALRAPRRDRALIEASLAGLCLGMSILTGAMAFSIMQAIFGVTALVYFGASQEAQDRRAVRTRVAAVLLAFVVVAAGSGAVQLLPAGEYSRLALRFIDGGTFPADKKIPYVRLVPGMGPQSIVSAVFATAFDGKFGGEEFFPFYIGVLPLFLAILAIWKCWGNRWVPYLAVLAVLVFVYSLGQYSPLNGVLYAVVPYLWATRTAGRFLYLVSFALALLAAFGLDTLLEETDENVSWALVLRILKWIAIACAAALFLPGVFTQLTVGIWNSLSLLLVLASCGYFAWLTRHPAGSWARFSVAAFVLFDLAAFSWLETDKAALSKAGDSLEQMITLRGPTAFVKSRPGLHRLRVSVEPQPNVGDIYEVESIWGGGATALTEYSRLGLRDDLLNVQYFIRPAATTDPGPVYQDGFWKVYENPKAFPRAWFVHNTVVEATEDAVFRRLDDTAIDLHATAVLAAPLPAALAAPAGTSESVRFRSYEPDHMALDVTTEKPGLLVLSEMYYPGWRATINGKPAEILRADGALRALATPAGSSRIEMEYAPLSFYAGAALSVLTFAGVLGAWFWSRRRFVSPAERV